MCAWPLIRQSLASISGWATAYFFIYFFLGLRPQTPIWSAFGLHGPHMDPKWAPNRFHMANSGSPRWDQMLLSDKTKYPQNFFFWVEMIFLALNHIFWGLDPERSSKVNMNAFNFRPNCQSWIHLKTTNIPKPNYLTSWPSHLIETKHPVCCIQNKVQNSFGLYSQQRD